MIDDSQKDKESMEYDAQAVKLILDGLPDSVKRNLGKYTSAKDIWDRLHDLHAKGALTMTMSQEEPIIEAENEKLDLIKLQVKERDEELAKFKKELDQCKRKHHEEVISMTNQLNEAKKQADALTSQLEQRHMRVNKLVEEIGKYKVEVSSLKSELQEAKKQAQGAEKKMKSSQAKDEEISKMKTDIISFKIVAPEATRSKEETEGQLAKKSNECEKLEEEIVLLRKKVEGMNKIMKSSQALDDMLSYHRSPSDKSGLGYVGEPSNKDKDA